MIPFNKPYLSGNELNYIKDAVDLGQLSGNGIYTKRCQKFLEDRYGFKKCLLTTSCTDALEMAAILCDIKPGDEVIMPSFTFVSTANAFVLRGARIVFVDSRPDRPGMDEDQLASLITPRTRVIVVVHYAGIACDMDKIMALADKHNLLVVEDAAHAIESYYKGRPLGGIGHLATFSFHETKNIISGEGGMLVVNDPQFEERSEIIWEKGTNRSAFWRGEVNKYTWMDIGSSFLPSEIIAAFLFAQLEHIDTIQTRRKQLWNSYDQALNPLQRSHHVKLATVPDWATNNAHLFYLVCRNSEERQNLIQHLEARGVSAVFHYLSLHKSPYYKDHSSAELKWSDHYADCLLRLPLFFELETDQINHISDCILTFYRG